MREEDREELYDKLEKRNKIACNKFAKCEKEILAGKREFDEYYCHCLVEMLETNFVGLSEVYQEYCWYVKKIEDYKKSITPQDDDYYKKEAYVVWGMAERIRSSYASLMKELQEDVLLARRALNRYPELKKRGLDDIQNLVEYLGARHKSYKETLMFVQEFDEKRVGPCQEFIKTWSAFKVAEEELRGRVFTEDDIEKE